MQLDTKRLILRPPVLADANEVSQYNQVEEFWQYTTIPNVPPSPEDTQAYIKSCIENANKNPGKVNYFMIVEKARNQVIGDIRLIVEDEKVRKAEFGYGLNPVFHGQGYMTETLKEVIRFGFDDLKLKRIYAVTYPENIASIKVMEKCGLKYEGTLRANTLIRGRYFDDVCYALIDTDSWRSASTSQS